MFYLSKRLDILVNKYLQRYPKGNESGGLKLSFEVDIGDGWSVTESVDGLVPKAIAKDGVGYRYLVGNGLSKLSGFEKGCAERAKCVVVEELAAANTALDIGSFDTAREIASRSLSAQMDRGRTNLVSYLIAHDTVGYGPLSILMEDRKRIEEIEVNAPSAPISIFHADYGRCATNLRFIGEAAFRHNINKLIYNTDKELGENSPIVDAQVGDARIHAQIRPYAQSGAVASVRLADNRLVGFDYLIRKNTTDFDVLAYLWLAMDSGLNIMIAGPPASGKTTLMSALFGFIPKVEKVLTIEEEINELKIKLDINNSVALYGSGSGRKVGTKDQVINALRLRPDRIVVGEVRGEETRELFSGANLGVPFMTTMHSNEGGMEIVKKLMVDPMRVETRSLNCLDIAIYMKHLGLSKRVLSDIYEYRWLSRAETDKLGTVIEESDSVDMSTIVSNGRLEAGSLQGSKVVEAFSEKSGLSKRLVLKELEKRSEFMKVVFEGCSGPKEMLEKLQGYACC